MEPLTEKQIKTTLADQRRRPESELLAMLDEFKIHHTPLYYLIFDTFANGLERVNEDMSNLFMDACADILWLYKQHYPIQRTIPQSEVDALLSALQIKFRPDLADNASHQRNRTLNTRIAQQGSINQPALDDHFSLQAHTYSCFDPARFPAVNLTISAFAVIMLLLERMAGRG
ncbi:MAG: hypothetical protein ACKV2V_11660 [Blastocatellia bacterium]